MTLKLVISLASHITKFYGSFCILSSAILSVMMERSVGPIVKRRALIVEDATYRGDNIQRKKKAPSANVSFYEQRDFPRKLQAYVFIISSGQSWTLYQWLACKRDIHD